MGMVLSKKVNEVAHEQKEMRTSLGRPCIVPAKRHVTHPAAATQGPIKSLGLAPLWETISSLESCNALQHSLKLTPSDPDGKVNNFTLWSLKR